MPVPPHSRSVIRGLLALATLLLAAPPASAWPTDPQRNLPIETVGNEGTYVQTAPDGSGGVYITWNDNRSGDYHIYAQHVLTSGITDPLWPVNGLAVCTATGGQSWPRIISDAAGGAFLCWMDYRTLGPPDIYADRLLTSGLDPAWPANGRAVCTAIGMQAQPRMVGDGGGGVIFTWFDQRTGAGNDDIYAQKLQSNGTLPIHGWPVNGRPICTAAGPQSDPCIVSDLAGGAVIAWSDQRSGPHIYAQHIAITGIVDAAWPVNGQLVCSQPSSKPLAVTDNASGAVIAWSDTRAGLPDIYAGHVLNNGTLDSTWPADGIPVCTAASTQTDLVMDVDGYGGAYLAWSDRRANGVDYDIYAHHLWGGGAMDTAWPEDGLPVCTDPGSQQLPSMAFTGDGFIVAWVGGTLRTQHVYGGGSIDPSWPSTGRYIGLGGYEWAPSVCAGERGGAIVAWQDARNGSTWSVYAQRVSNNSALGNDFLYVRGFPGLYRATTLWADLNGDEYLDLLACGSNTVQSQTDAYGWNGSAFSALTTNLPGVEWCSVAPGDYDGDGDVDLAMCGWSNGQLISRIYRNTGNGTFVWNALATLPGVSAGSVAWGDVDNDGDLDLFLAGQKADLSLMAQVYINNGNGTFSDAGFLLTGVMFSDAKFADFDNDGDLDLAVCGWDGSIATTKLYKNEFGGLVDSGIFLNGVWEGGLDWADVNADGIVDLMVTGWDGSLRRADLYYGIGANLFPAGAWAPGLSSSAVAAGDMDNDGDPDFVTSGNAGGGGATVIERRDDVGSFQVPAGQFTGVYYSDNAWGDFDHDGNLELAVVGTDGGINYTTVYKSYATTPNAPPSPPGSPSVTWSGGNRATFSWTPATDDHTPQASLTYNLKVGTTPGGNQKMPAMSANGGRPRVAQMGNCGTRTSWTITLPPGTYYWNVQAIDGAFLGSTFAAGVTTTAVGDGSLPGAAGLQPASPNPFRARTEIAFTLPRAGDVELAVFDPAGRRVRELSRGAWPAGLGRVSWDGRDAAGAAVANGLYLVRLESEGRAWTGKVVVMR